VSGDPRPKGVPPLAVEVPPWTADEDYLRARDLVWARSFGQCEAGLPGCLGAVGVVHHRAGRGFAGCHHPDLLLAACDPCHLNIHAHPSSSYESGLMLRRNGTWSPGDLCSVTGCSKLATRRGWCGTHYQRWRLHGDALWEAPSDIERFWLRAGEAHPQTHLTEAEVAEMKVLRAQGWCITTLGERYGVHSSTVSRICNGKQWVRHQSGHRSGQETPSEWPERASDLLGKLDRSADRWKDVPDPF
jgi:hypothetical protein